MYMIVICWFERYKFRKLRSSEISRSIANENNDTTNVSTRKLSKIYDKKVHAVKEVDLKIHRKEILGLLGPNGAGKSTTFNMITM
jgi:ABC-type uncharacterized transport system ATPase subunit